LTRRNFGRLRYVDYLIMTFLQPIWLVLLIPLLMLWWRGRSYVPLTILLLIVLALAGLTLQLPSRAGTVVVVADRSRSMPANAEAAELEAIQLLQRAMGSESQLAVVSFGQRAVVERAPQAGPFAGFTQQVGGDASNLEEALEMALSLIPPDANGRVLVLSDGRWTGEEPSAAAARAATRGIGLDYRAVQRPAANDLAIEQIDAPVSVTPGEAFMITAWVRAPLAQELSYELKRGEQVLAAGKTQASTGLNRLTFRDLAGAGGAQRYTLRVQGSLNPAADPQPENNTARLLVGVQGPKPLLHVTTAVNGGLARLLNAGGLNVQSKTPEQCEWTLDALANYAGVLLENVPASQLGERGMETLAAWVSETGAGLMMTGGKNAYGPGGYFKSPLEPLLPVSMELRQEHRKLTLAIVVAMDRSGSMAAPVSGGRTKMDLANLAAVQVLDLLGPQDEFGVTAVDSASHIIADLAPVEQNKDIRSSILSVDSGGGGIFVYEALTTAAQMMLKATAGAKHIILFADAADAEEPGEYKALLAECEKSGITVSVIGLGKPTDSDAELLRDVAKRGNGQSYFTESAEELPRLFAQDTIIVARSTFLEQATPVQFTGGLVTLTGKQFPAAPALGGYNLTYLRPQANLAALTTDEYNAPVVAAWQAGSGRALAYTGEADGQFAGAFANWAQAGEYFTSLARWTAGGANGLPNDMLLTQEVKNGVSLIQLHLDPETVGTDKALPLTTLPQVTTLRGVPGAKPVSDQSEMRWVAADTLEVAVPLQGAETALSAVEVPGYGRVTLAPVTLPYSPEFKPAEAARGAETLAQLAQATGGQERLDLGGVWQALPRRLRLVELAPYLLLLAAILLLLEVLERQTGLLSQRAWPLLAEARVRLPQRKWRQRGSPRSAEPAPVPSEPLTNLPLVDAPISAPAPVTDLKASAGEPLKDALAQARERARAKTRR
jgi:Mg-chelatase subunit ChlD